MKAPLVVLALGVTGLLVPACDRRLNVGASLSTGDAAARDASTGLSDTATGLLGTLATNGAARLDNGVLLLTADAPDQAGSAFLPQPIDLASSRSIVVRVVFRIKVTFIAADGLALVMQSTAAGPAALGGVGGGIGYGGFTPSVAVQVDTHDELGAGQPRDLAVVVDGENHMALSRTPSLPLDPADGAVHTLWVRFAPGSVDAWLADSEPRPIVPLLAQNFPVWTHFPGPVWLGLTASTGAKYAQHEVLDFQVTVER